MRAWYLEGFIGDSKALRRVLVSEYPYRVGRRNGLPLILKGAGISRVHAEITKQGDQLVVRDLNSTNGTFLNRRPVTGSEPLRDGDILHFADMEFRLIEQQLDQQGELERTRRGISALPEDLPRGTREFQQLLLDSMVSTVFQPIVDPVDRSICAYEILGRGAHESLSKAPNELFRIAESLDLEIHLSELMRRCGLSEAASADSRARYFSNVHPAELHFPERLLQNIAHMRELYPQLDLVLEFHEGSVTDIRVIQMVRHKLKTLDVSIAYDDFGTGQARLVELTEVPPDYIKFDMKLIRNLDQAPDAKRQMVSLLCKFARDMGIQVVAEGVSREPEADLCEEMGFDLCQGYLYGRPQAELPEAA